MKDSICITSKGGKSNCTPEVSPLGLDVIMGVVVVREVVVVIVVVVRLGVVVVVVIVVGVMLLTNPGLPPNTFLHTHFLSFVHGVVFSVTALLNQSL